MPYFNYVDYEYITVMRSAEAIVRQRICGGIAAAQAESRKPR